MKLISHLKNMFVLLCVLIASTGISQSSSYKAEMKKHYAKFTTSVTKSEFLRVAGNFETLAISEKKEWLPFYYAGLCDAIAAFDSEKKDIDALCDKGDKLVRKADSLSPGNSEIEVLKSMLAAARITVNEKQRGQKYGAMVSKYANAALKLNNNNPRAYLLKGRALLYMPAAFGGGAKKAKPLFEQALEKFKSDKPAEFYPAWGKEEVEAELKKLNEFPSK